MRPEARPLTPSPPPVGGPLETSPRSGRGTRRRREDGFVIVAVLLLVVALGAVAAGMLLETGLTTLGARSAAHAAAARAAAHAGLLLALDELRSATGPTTVPRDVGPWSGLGAGVSGRVTQEEGSDPPAYRVMVTAIDGRASARARAVVVLDPAFAVLEWRE